MIFGIPFADIAFWAGALLIAAGAVRAIVGGGDIALAALFVVGTALLLSPKLETLTVGKDGATIKLAQSSQALTDQVTGLAKSLESVVAQQGKLAAQVAEIAKQSTVAAETAPRLNTIQEESGRIGRALDNSVRELGAIARTQQQIIDRMPR
jgi:methyl-accepting chemotaxis protein